MTNTTKTAAIDIKVGDLLDLTQNTTFRVTQVEVSPTGKNVRLRGVYESVKPGQEDRLGDKDYIDSRPTTKKVVIG